MRYGWAGDRCDKWTGCRRKERREKKRSGMRENNCENEKWREKYNK